MTQPFGTALLILFIAHILEVVIVPGSRLRTGNDPGNIGIFSACLMRLVRLSYFGFLAATRLLLLAFLLGTLACALLLSNFRPVRHGELPV
ncbi:MAG TPA: hypothetical protein VL882_19055 [Vicinamibacterales bacterium]|nr:hypothetical protein [Vicinamibacterales bacterium]